MTNQQAAALTWRIIGKANANWMKHGRTTYPPDTLLCTGCRFEVGDAQPTIRLVGNHDGWQARVMDHPPRPLTRWQWVRRWLGLPWRGDRPCVRAYRIYEAVVFPRLLEYIVFDMETGDDDLQVR